MRDDEGFKPRLGRSRASGSRRGRAYLHRVLAATNLARGNGAPGHAASAFTGSRAGRGSGVGRLLGSRDRHRAFRARRVIVKASIVRLAGKGAAAAAAHLRYLQRDGTTREGERGALYGAQDEALDGKTFLGRGNGDRHQFRFIVSAEDGDQYDDLKPLTRRLMARIEQDLGTRLDWVAVDHHNTGHPHTHIVVRGKDERGRDLVLAREYLTTGIRERACELVDLDLGPRGDRAIEARLRAEIDQERLTSIDQKLLAAADGQGTVAVSTAHPFDQALRTGRLAKLTRMGLAHPSGHGQWTLADDLEATLRRMGERGDIIRTMQRAYAAKNRTLAVADMAIHDPGCADTPPLIGRIVERGLADEQRDHQYLIVEATDGRTHYVDIGRADTLAQLVNGAVVEVAPAPSEVRPSDHVIAAVAAQNDGRYDIAAHRRQDPSATLAFAEAHVRRLEALRRRGIVARNEDASWTIAPDHVERIARAEREAGSARAARVRILSASPADNLVARDKPTWLDEQLTSAVPLPLRDAGFGKTLGEALDARRRWLINEGLAGDQAGRFVAGPGMVESLHRRALLQIARKLERELGLSFVESRSGENVAGVLAKPVEAGGRRYAVVQTSREFTLVPWRPVLDRHVGKSVHGTLRGGRVSWSIGRSRTPSIS